MNRLKWRLKKFDIILKFGLNLPDPQVGGGSGGPCPPLSNGLFSFFGFALFVCKLWFKYELKNFWCAKFESDFWRSLD